MFWRGPTTCGLWMTLMSLHLMWRGNHWQKSATYWSHRQLLFVWINSLQVNPLLWISRHPATTGTPLQQIGWPTRNFWQLYCHFPRQTIDFLMDAGIVEKRKSCTTCVLTWNWSCHFLPKLQVRGGSGVVREPSRPEDIRCMPQWRKIAGLLVQTWIFLSCWSSSTSGLLVWSKLKFKLSVGLPGTPRSIGFLLARKSVRLIWWRSVSQLEDLAFECEINKSKFGKRKYHRGHWVEGNWVFGTREKFDKSKMFMFVVNNQNKRWVVTTHQEVD